MILPNRLPEFRHNRSMLALPERASGHRRSAATTGRLRILHVVPTYLPATRYGGPIYAVHGLCRALASRDHEVDVYTTNVDGDRNSEVPIRLPVDLDGVKVHYFAPSHLPLARRLYYSPTMRRALLHQVQLYDIVHLHSVFLWPTSAAARAARQHQVPYIVSPRGMLVPELIRRKNRLLKTSWIRVVERRTFIEASSVHFTAQPEWDEARRTGIQLPSPFVVPNGIDLPPLPSTSRLPATLLFLGRVNWKKGLDRLIDALALVPDARLIIAGNDEEELTPKLRVQAERNGIADRIDFRGPGGGAAKEGLLATSQA